MEDEGCATGGSFSVRISACSTAGFFVRLLFSPANEDLRRLPVDLLKALSFLPAAAAFLAEDRAAFFPCGPAVWRNQEAKEEAPRSACLRARSRPLTNFCLRLGSGAGGGSLDMSFEAGGIEGC